MMQWGGRMSAIAAFAAAGILTTLIVSLAGGALPAPAVLDALSVGTAAAALVVVVLAYAGAPTGAWSQAGRALGVSGMTLVLAGDAFQAVATRFPSEAGLMWSISFAIRDGIGNGLFYASLVVLGTLLVSRHRWIGGLAVANGALGFLAMLVADRLGLPPHLNFMLLVVWFVVLGAAWWRTAPSGVTAEARAAMAADTA
jgi:hypothetical protein